LSGSFARGDLQGRGAGGGEDKKKPGRKTGGG